jgi:hypothetical protein
MNIFYQAEYAVVHGGKTEDDVLRSIHVRDDADWTEPPAANGASH